MVNQGLAHPLDSRLIIQVLALFAEEAAHTLGNWVLSSQDTFVCVPGGMDGGPGLEDRDRVGPGPQPPLVLGHWKMEPTVLRGI